jgi:hypothetical protein
VWHGKVEPLKWVTSAPLPCKTKRDKTRHEHAYRSLILVHVA